MIKFAIGYQLPEPDEEPFIDIVRDFQDHIGEVYFPWLDMPSGRSPMTQREGCVDWSGQQKMESDLMAIKAMGIKLDLLFNANCYGGQALSVHLQNHVCSVVEYLHGKIGIDAVTTTSLMIAQSVKKYFPEIEVRASVNMRIGTVKGMEYVQDLFDSFCMQREYNRNFSRIQGLKTWADNHEKKLVMLANSGCLNFCSGQSFHDNLVAHESEISRTRNISDWNPCVCWNFYQKQENRTAFLQNSWVRPEDIHHYEEYFTLIKLATRMHANPRRVIQAYCEQDFPGNLVDLLGPGHGPLFRDCGINNKEFPEDWFEQTSSCDKKCHECGYCQSVMERVG